MTAAVDGLKQLGMRRISLLTPYRDEFNQPIKAYLQERDIEVLNIGSFLLDEQKQMVGLPPAAIRDAAIETLHPDADGLFISCTAIRATGVIESLESALNKPVLTSLQCLFWDALRASGYRDAVPGWGKLLRLPAQIGR
jgi:maleate isomerase